MITTTTLFTLKWLIDRYFHWAMPWEQETSQSATEAARSRSIPSVGLPGKTSARVELSSVSYHGNPLPLTLNKSSYLLKLAEQPCPIQSRVILDMDCEEICSLFSQSKASTRDLKQLPPVFGAKKCIRTVHWYLVGKNCNPLGECWGSWICYWWRFGTTNGWVTRRKDEIRQESLS